MKKEIFKKFEAHHRMLHMTVDERQKQKFNVSTGIETLMNDFYVFALFVADALLELMRDRVEK